MKFVKREVNFAGIVATALICIIIVFVFLPSAKEYGHGRNLGVRKINFVVVSKPSPFPKVILAVEPEEVELSDFPDTPRGEIRRYIYEICQDYPNVDPLIIEAQVFEESRYISSVVGGGGAWLGLMQISPKWHHDRMERLGVTDLFDPYSNLLVGIDYMSELIDIYHDKVLALMVYNGSASAYSKWESGQISSYAQNVMNNVYILKNGGELNG